MMPEKAKTPVIRVGENEVAAFQEMELLLARAAVQTVCRLAHCPNQVECFLKRTATFMILGDVCTRRCAFCAVRKGHPEPLDHREADRICEAASLLRLRYVVVTAVTRDDLPDGGASQFADLTRCLRKRFPGIRVEVLVPDFAGSTAALQVVLAGRPDVLGHNVETVPRLYATIRPEADYRRSLELLKTAKKLSPGIVTKSGLMLGLGERKEEAVEVLKDLRSVQCDMVSLGQYLAPSPSHQRVIRYLGAEEFQWYERTATNLGFRSAESHQLARSSYRAEEAFRKVRGERT